MLQSTLVFKRFLDLQEKVFSQFLNLLRNPLTDQEILCSNYRVMFGTMLNFYDFNLCKNNRQ